MRRNMKMMSLAAASLIATTAGALAQGYVRYEHSGGWQFGGPSYYSAPPSVAYYPGTTGWYGPMNGANHPAPASTQGDVGPEGNNNGTRTGIYSRW